MSFDINNFRGAFPPQLCETKAPDCRVGFDHGLPALERYQAIYPWTLAMNASGNTFGSARSTISSVGRTYSSA